MFQADCRNTGSAPNARTKLSNPTNRGGFGEINRAFVNESPKASSTGITRNRIIKIPAGAIIEMPAQAWLRLFVRREWTRRDRVDVIVIREYFLPAGGGALQLPHHCSDYSKPYPSLDSMLASISATA